MGKKLPGPRAKTETVAVKTNDDPTATRTCDPRLSRMLERTSVIVFVRQPSLGAFFATRTSSPSANRYGSEGPWVDTNAGCPWIGRSKTLHHRHRHARTPFGLLNCT